MAGESYKIQIGTELDTSGIDQKVKNYKGNVEVGSTFDTSGITKILNAYKPKPLNVNTKLSTKGITEAIKSYKAKKDIKVKIDPDFTGVNTAIETYQAKPLGVKVELNWVGVVGQIKNFQTEEKVRLNAELNDEAISDSIKTFNTANKATKIKIGVDPDFDGINNKIGSYTPRTLMKINAKVNKNQIDNSIKDFKTSSYVKVGVQLKEGAIETAVGKYAQKEVVPVAVDFKVGGTQDVDAKITSYKNTPVDVPVRLTPAKTGFSDKITTTPVKVSATVDKDDIRKDIETAVGGYTPTAKMPVNIKLTMPKDINSQVKGLGKPTEPIDVGVKLDEDKINADIALFKPTATLGIQPDLILENVDDQIRAYVPKAPIRVNVQVSDSDIDKGVKEQNTQTPITVNVKLDREKLNEQIRTFTTKTKVKVGIKLNSKGIAEQIRKIEPKTKIKVGVKLDKDSVRQQIQGFKTDAPIKLGIELDKDSIQNIKSQIGNVRKQIQDIGNIRINLGGNGAGGLGGGTGSLGGISGNGGGNIINNMSEIITTANNSIHTIQRLRESLASAKFDNASINLVTQHLEQMDIAVSKVAYRIRNNNLRLNITGTDEMRNAVTVLKEIDLATGEITNIGKNISRSFGQSKEEIRQVNAAYREMKSLIKEITGTQIKINNARAAGQEFGALEIKLAALNARYDELEANFAGGFDVNQTRNLQNEWQKVAHNINIANEALQNTSNANTVKELNKEMASFVKLQSQIANMKTKIGGLEIAGGKSNQVAELKAQLEGLENTYDSLMRTFMQKLTINADIMPFEDVVKFDDEIAAAVEKAENKLRELDAKYADTRAKLASEIKLSFDNGDFNVLSKINLEVQKLKGDYPELTSKIEDARLAIGKMEAAIGTGDEVAEVEKLISAYNEFQNALQKIKNQLDLTKAAEKDAADVQKLNDDIVLFQNKIDAYLTKNSAAANEFGSKLLDLRAKAQGCDRVTLNHLEAEFKQVDKAVEAAGKKTQTFGDSLKAQIKRYSSYLSVASVIMYATQAMRSMFEQVKLIDSAMTELKKVTNETDASYDKFLENAASRAKELGTTIDGLVSSTADFARLGYGFKESQQLAEVANIYAVVGDEIEGVEDATQSLVSTMAAFKGEMNGMSDGDFAMGIVDKMNEVSNNFAISSGGIGEALQRSASSMAAANNTLDETIAMITAANEVAQNPEKVGNAMKTMSMRIRGAKTELEEAGESTDGMAESTASLRAEMLALSGVDIMLDKHTFKSTYQIMDELSHKWENLSDIAQATIIELVAGKHQGNVFSSLMANFQTARDALTTSLGSSGSAMKEHAKWSESLEARLNKLKAAWQGLSQSFMSSDFLKTTLDAVIGLVDGITKLIDTLGMLGTIGLGTGIFNIIKHLKDFTNIRIFAALPSELKSVGMGFRALGYDLKSFIKTPAGIASAIGLVTAAVGLLVNAYKKAKEEQSRLRKEAIQASDEFLDAAGSFEQAYIKYSGRTDLTAEEESELESAIQGTVDALGDKSSALQGVVNSSNDYLASLEAITNAELKAANNAAKEKRTAAEKELKSIVEPNAAQFLDGDSSSVNVVIERRNAGSDNPDDASEAEKIAREAAGKYYQLLDANRGSKYYGFELPSNASVEDIVDYYYSLIEAKNRLLENDLGETDTFDSIDKAINQMSESISVYESGVYDAVKAQYQLSEGIPKTIEEYIAMRESILRSNDISGLSLDTKMSILNSIDSEYGQLFDLSTVEAQARKFVGIIKGFGDGTKDGTDEIGTVETFLNMRTALNNNECTVGEYLSELDNITSMSEKFSDEEKKQFNLAYGLDTDSIKKQYEDVYNYISRNYLDKLNTANMSSFNASEFKNHEEQKIKDILNGLSATELQAVANIKGEIDWETTNIDGILAQIKEEAKFIEAMNYTIAIDVETESLDALNSALSESVSGAGLSSEAITALKGRYAELASQGYDLSAMFEETSNGIHLNKNAVSEFEQALASQKFSETDGKLDVLKKRYDELTNEIETCTDAGERAHLYSEQQEVAQKINDLATLASQYKGLTSAYNAWQNAESAGNERDMYENIISGFETIEDEISRGWYDDGTIKFLELMTGKTDLAGKSASELKEIWNSLDDTIKGTSYSVKDFFTTDEDGNSTSTGAYNFLRAVEELGKNGGLKALEGKNIEDLIVRNDKGKIVEFDFDIVGGDAAIAKALGVSEEMVQIIQRTLDDAGFVVTLDGKYTLLADLKTSAEESNNALKKLQSEGLKNLKDLDLNFDFDVDTVEGYQEQLEKALNVLDKFRNKDGTLQTDKNGNLVKGAKEALEIAEYYTAAMDKLTEPKFMQIDTSTVDSELQDPIEKMQTIGDLCKEKHLVSLTGDTKELDKVQGEINKVAKEIEELDPEVKAQIGIDDSWDAKTIADKIEKGEIEIPAELKLDVQMSEDLKDIRLLMMRQLGLVDDNEIKLKIGYDIDDSTVDKLIKDGKEEIVIEFITKNEEWFDKLTDDKKEIVIDLVSSGVDLSSIEDEKKKVVVEYIEKDAEWFNKLDDEEKKVIVNYVAEHGEIDKWSPEAKEAFVKYLVDGGDPDTFDPEDKESWVVYKKDTDIPDSYIPINPNALVTYDKDSSVPDNYDPNDPDATVKYGKDSLIPDNYIPLDPPATVVFDKDTSAVDSYNPPDIFRKVYYTIVETVQKVASGGKSKAAQRTGADPDGKGTVDGTANVNGTIGKAFKQGSWGTKNSGTALGGELGREILVRDGRWFTIGDNGAEFFKYKKGDIIFNHRQSDELLKNGRVTSGSGRAKALVNGTAFVHGTAFSKGSGGGEEPEVTSITVGVNKNTGASYTKSADKDDFEETIDWIETAIDRIERAIDQLDTKASSTYRSWSERNSNLSKQISKVSDEIELQQSAYEEYMAAANAVGLSSSYAAKVRNGTIDIETIKDEGLKAKIDDYENWYSKALDCKDAILELQEAESSLYAQRFENIQTQYDGILQGYEHTEAMLNEYISQAEEQGYIVSKKYYQALVDNEKQNIAELKKEQADLIAARDEAVASGKIAKNSEEWVNMCAEIDSVTQAIEESTTALLEFDNAMRDIDWQIFDLIQERISDITAESEFLIELMSNKDLFDDNGKFTERGVATVGLRALNYNTSMYQADDYGKEVAKLDKQIAKDPYDQELINRRRELIELQRESILNAESEKNAIKDLVEEGINLELDALQERIDLHNEELDSMKNLYDYQKNVEEQTENIASLRKQLGAYEGFDDEETRAKVQELKVSLEEAEADLEETEYDKFISDQTALLDTLYTEYETILNSRLDNIDFLLEQVIDGINAAAGAEGTITSALGADGAIAAALGSSTTTIGETLKTEVGNVGTKLSTAMSNIWLGDGSGKAVLDLYGKDFQTRSTTANDALNSIKANVNAMVDDVDKDAKKKVEAPKTQPSTKADPTKGSNNGNNGNNNNKQNNASSNQRTDKEHYGVALAVWNGGYGWGNGDERKKRLKEKGFDASKVQSVVNRMGKEGYVHTAAWIKKYYGITDKDLKKYSFNSYAVGKQNFLSDEVAWTQENGQEFIVRPSDGAILTPVAKGDSVLTSAASNNIWDMANSPAEFIKDNLNLGATSVPNNSTVQSNYTQHLDKVVFNFPNVKNYEEMLSAMQKDKNFERLVLSMSIDRIAGKSSLAKGKSIR